MRRVLQTAGALLLVTLAQTTPAFDEDGVKVVHSPGSDYLVNWTQRGPVDVFVSSRPDTKVSAMRLLAAHDSDSKFQAHIPDIEHPYFALRGADGSIYRTAERLLPLEGGSNFRDLGGYPAANGKHTRWGILFRSAAMPKLTDVDYAYLSNLRIKTIVDLRSVDERQLSPTEWRAKPGARYLAVDYPGEVLFSRLRDYNGPQRESVTERLYADIPVLLRQQYKQMFQELLAHRVPLVISDSDGQDRTGIAAALVLSALGAPRSVIYQDYLLSTQDRTPANEMANVDLQKYAATNSEAQFLIAYRDYTEKSPRAAGNAPKTQPLMDSKGRPLLQGALDQIERDYGSIASYLDRELGVGAKDIDRLRRMYLD